MRLKRWFWFTVAACSGYVGLCSQGLAQQQAAPVYGSVSGLISCTDTNLPARLTSVTLQPVPAANATITHPLAAEDASTPLLTTHRSGIDGSFSIPRVRPGTYFVVVQRPGYLSPVSEFTPEEVAHPDDAQRRHLLETIPTVTVVPYQTSAINIRLVRAASLTGTVRYDDGSPAPQFYLNFERKDAAGKWISTNIGRAGGQTNDQGLVRISGLSAGEYRINTRIEVDDTATNALFGSSRSTASRTRYQLRLYYGDTFLQKDAKVLKVEDGQELSAELVIPASRLHSVSGSLVEAGTAHVINAGTINVYAAGETVEMATARVSDDEPAFRFDFLPEGTYTVRVTDARDVVREPIPLPRGTVSSPQYKEVTVRSFGSYEGTLTVQSDQTGWTISIPPKPARAGQ